MFGTAFVVIADVYSLEWIVSQTGEGFGKINGGGS